MRLVVVGAGRVGLVVAACFADAGHQVTCIERDPARVACLRGGRAPFHEPGLDDLVRRNVEESRLSFTSTLGEAVAGAEVVFIAVGTPESDGGHADVGQVLEVAHDIGRALTGYCVIVNKSTVPVGTAERVQAAIASETTHAFDVASNPEFLQEGAAVADFFSPDRVVIGTQSSKAREVLSELHAAFMRTEPRLVFMDARSAELTKYAANAMLALRISYMNDLAEVCERAGADIERVRHGLGTDVRIGPSHLFAGVGFGGPCLPKDVRALTAFADEMGFDFRLLRAVENTNERHKRSLVERAKAHFTSLGQRTFAVWGLSFKPGTDDLREAPAVTLVEALLEAGAEVRAFDPVATEAGRLLFGSRVTWCEHQYDALEGADGLFVVTEWNEFREPDFARMRALLRHPVIFDGRALYAPHRMRELGFVHIGIGRGVASNSRGA